MWQPRRRHLSKSDLQPALIPSKDTLSHCPTRHFLLVCDYQDSNCRFLCWGATGQLACIYSLGDIAFTRLKQLKNAAAVMGGVRVELIPSPRVRFARRGGGLQVGSFQSRLNSRLHSLECREGDAGAVDPVTHLTYWLGASELTLRVRSVSA